MNINQFLLDNFDEIMDLIRPGSLSIAAKKVSTLLSGYFSQEIAGARGNDLMIKFRRDKNIQLYFECAGYQYSNKIQITRSILRQIVEEAAANGHDFRDWVDMDFMLHHISKKNKQIDDLSDIVVNLA